MLVTLSLGLQSYSMAAKPARLSCVRTALGIVLHDNIPCCRVISKYATATETEYPVGSHIMHFIDQKLLANGC